ncbi:MAG: hypothetical protein WC314_28120 [Vulcanimicrobiota bacterium]
MTRARGSILIVVLMLITVLLVMGMGFLASRVGEYRAARQAVLSVQAKGLAMAGMEETRVKLLKDFDFPPIAAIDQPAYQVVEPVHDLDGTTVLGFYEATVETDKIAPPYYLLTVDSVGLVGSDRTAPQARRRLRARIDLRDPDTNPNYFKVVGIQDFGEL